MSYIDYQLFEKVEGTNAPLEALAAFRRVALMSGSFKTSHILVIARLEFSFVLHRHFYQRGT